MTGPDRAPEGPGVPGRSGPCEQAAGDRLPRGTVRRVEVWPPKPKPLTRPLLAMFFISVFPCTPISVLAMANAALDHPDSAVLNITPWIILASPVCALALAITGYRLPATERADQIRAALFMTSSVTTLLTPALVAWIGSLAR